MAVPLTKTDLANIAAGFLGEQPLASIEPPSTKEAAAWARCYDLIREDILCAHNWNFAMTLKTLTVSATAPQHTWTYAYDLPDNFLRFIRIEGQSATRPEKYYEVMGRQLFYDDAAGASINIEYMANVTDLSLWQPNARMAFAKYLAKEMVFYYQKNNRTVERLEGEYIRALKLAISTDTSERPPRRNDESAIRNKRAAYTGNQGASMREEWS